RCRLGHLPASDVAFCRSVCAGAPAVGTAQVAPLGARTSDDLWLDAADFRSPSTPSLASLAEAPGPDGQVAVSIEALKAMPTFFDADHLVAEQHFATSADGTRIPYFLLRRADLPFDSAAPTLLYGYGGFEISLTPMYSGVLGRSWLSRGGVYALANIRGGGEYGPAWHQAALKA